MEKREEMEGLEKLNVLITGATGFIGSHVLEQLYPKHKVIILIRKNSNLWRIKPFLDYIKVFDVKDIGSAFELNKIDIVIHLTAKYHKHHKSLDEVSEIIESNIQFPTSLLQRCLKHNVKYFINTGTFFEYKESRRPLKEKSKKEPYNLYAASKIAFEDILKYYASQTLKVITLRLFSPYGEKDNKKLILSLIESLETDREIDIYDGSQKLNWTYVKDIASAYEKAIEYAQAMKKNYNDFNICSDQALSIKEVIRVIEQLKNKKLKVNYHFSSPYRDVFYSKGDNSKAKKIMGWYPKYDFFIGIKKTLDFYEVGKNDL